MASPAITGTRVRKPFVGRGLKQSPAVVTRLVPAAIMGTARVGWRYRDYPVIVLPVPPAQVIVPVVITVATPTFSLRASRNTVFALRASQAAVCYLRATPLVVFSLRASLMSISSNLVFFRGEDIVLNLQMTPAVDITGWTIVFKAALGLAGSIAITISASITDGPRGRFQVVIPSASTASLTVGRYVWDCRREDSGNKSTLADGYLDLKQEVTT